ncbi:Hypothetical protein FKW44_023342 [Caligus rogercresseyi]|uniref:Uncharacterized protein n=1 Tax=Caligus rogercresseyi TaxID=217165 RepID=A0A7T8JU37_CALRO|nr:Hypothetical protein FKW44_023342 [Caligus rogercresseyi]
MRAFPVKLDLFATDLTGRMLHFPTLREHIASPAQITDVMRDFIAKLKETSLVGWMDLLCPQRLWPLPETHSPQKKKETYLPEQSKQSLPSTRENSFLNLLTCSHLLPWPWRFATMGQQSSGVM